MAYSLTLLLCALAVAASVLGGNGYKAVNVLTPSACISKGPGHTLKRVYTTGKLAQKTFTRRAKHATACWKLCAFSKPGIRGAACVEYTYNLRTKTCTIFTNKFERDLGVVHGTWMCQKMESQRYLSVEAIQGHKVIGQSLNATFRGKVGLAPGRKGLSLRLPVCTSQLRTDEEHGCIGWGRCSSGFSLSIWIRPRNTWHFFVKKGKLLFVLYRRKQSQNVYIRALVNKKMVYKGYGHLRSRAGWVHIFLSVSARRTGMFAKAMVDAQKTFPVEVNHPIARDPGVLRGPINIMASLRDEDNLNIGCHEGWNMLVDEIRFWKSSLSIAVVEALYKSEKRGVPRRVPRGPVMKGPGQSENETMQTTEEKAAAVSNEEPARQATGQEPEKSHVKPNADYESGTSENEAEQRNRREEEELQKSNNGTMNGKWSPGSKYCLPMSRIEHNQVIGPLNGAVAGNVSLAPGLGRDHRSINIATCGGNVTYCGGNTTCRDENGTSDDCLSNRGRCVYGFTISLMVLPPRRTPWSLGISKGSVRFVFQSSGQRSVRVKGFTARGRFYGGKAMLNEGGWLHVVIVVDERLEVKVNLNGVKVTNRQRRPDGEPKTLLKGATTFGAVPSTRHPCVKDKGIHLDEIRLWNSTICTHSCRKLYQMEKHKATGATVVV
ncbi:uncharacterized protein LOC135500224 [Lineus longissimus]|uniref:uncharacterized protein LOC135500224 n=1 Tax=Lineus longissimus TaxID=88925 RepID=UPI002B4C5B44